MFDFLKKKKLVYSAIGYEVYARMVGKLQNAGIKYSVKTNVNNFRNAGSRMPRFNDDKYKIYDIYVKVEDEGKAIKALNEKY